MASTEESAEQRASGSEVPAAMEVSTPSARLSEEEEAEQWLEDESLASLVGRPSSPSLSLSLTTDFEHEETLGFASLGSQLPGASGSRWINNSGKAWAWAALLGSDSCEAGDEDDDDADMTEKEHMFDKVVTPSDVGKLNRLVIPRQHAEKYFPLDASSANNKGLLLSCEDSAGKQWGFRYSYWISSQSYVVTKGWSRFVKEKRLAAGDTVSFSRGAGDAARHRLFIDCKHRMPASRGPRRPSRRRRPAPLYEHHQKDQDLNKDPSDIYAAAPWPAGRQHPFLGSAGTPMPMNIIPATSSPMLVDDDLGSEESVPLADSPTAAVKRTRLFGISLNSPPWNRDLQQTGGNKEGSDTG